MTLSGEYKEPLVRQLGANLSYDVTARRFYGDPYSVPALMEESGIGFPLILRDQSYGREAFLMTNRTSEPLVSSSLDGILPLNDPLTGNSELNMYPLEMTSRITIGATGSNNFSNYSGSDNVEYELERFRAPVPYSRVRFTQELSNAYSNFEGLFSYNPGEPTNLTLALYRRAAGRAPDQVVSATTFNPRVDNWWVRSQGAYHTSAMDASIFFLYTTAFSGLNGGVVKKDSATDIFDAQLAQVATPQSYDHRVRTDVMGELAFSLFSETERTKLAGFATSAARRVVVRDSGFPLWYNPYSAANRYGLMLSQPIGFSLGTFLTRAILRGDLQYLDKAQEGCDCSRVKETRYSGYASDSLFVGGDVGLSLDGYLRATLSQLSLGGASEPDQFLTNFGVSALVKLSRYVDLSTFVSYARDRASLSPSPLETYELKNFGAYANFGVPFSSHDSIALSLGYLSRSEPEGIVPGVLDSTEVPRPYFSSLEMQSSSFRGSLDIFLMRFRIAAKVNYTPEAKPVSPYTNNPALESPMKARTNGIFGIYYENEVAEGNLRLSLGARTRYMSELTPALTYDGASDYFVYKGLEEFNGAPIQDSRLTSRHFMFDIIATTEIDRRAQVNILLLNILGEPYYTVSFYPRTGFLFKIDVTWAFLD
jgi:hypothetical protein